MPEDGLGATTMRFGQSRHNWSHTNFLSKEQVHYSITVSPIENRDEISSLSILS